MSQATGKPHKAWLRLLCFLPPATLLAAFLCFSVDVPYLDQWEFVPFLQKAMDGALTPHDFWAQHNEHRILFPRLIMLALARATHWDLRAELALNFLLGAALFALLAWQAGAAAKNAGRGEAWGLRAILSLIVFSLSQWQNWFLGWQLQEFLSLFFVLAALFLLDRSRSRVGFLALAAAAGVVGTYSFANGMLIWPIGAAMLCVSGWNHANRQNLALWAAAGILTACSYLYDYHTPSYHPPLSAVLRHPIEYPLYVLRYLGQPVLNWNGTAAAWMGGAGLLAWIVLLYRTRVEKHVFASCLGLGLYAIGSALITGLARIEFGPDQAMSSRYITLANPLWLAIAFLAWSLPPGRKSRWLPRAAWTLAVLLVMASLYGGYRWTERYHAYSESRSALMAGDRPELLKRLYPDVPRLLERREILRKYRLSVFR